MSKLKFYAALAAAALLAGCGAMPELPDTNKVEIALCYTKSDTTYGRPEELSTPVESVLSISTAYQKEFVEKLAAKGISTTLIHSCKPGLAPADSVGVLQVFFAVGAGGKPKLLANLFVKDPKNAKGIYRITSLWLDQLSEEETKQAADESAKSLAEVMKRQ